MIASALHSRLGAGHGRPWIGVLAAIVLAGCASLREADPYASEPVARHLQSDDDVGRCARLLREADRHVDEAGARDAMAPRVAGFPYLRVDRFTAALGARTDTPAQFSAWLQLMALQDQQARRFEDPQVAGAPPLAAVESCRYIVATADDRPELREALRRAAVVPDDYSDLMRALGLYPLTRLAFARGVRHWQRETEATFAQPLGQLPQEGQLHRYAPVPTMPKLPRLIQAPDLGLPVRDAAGLRALISHHAPLLDIDTVGDPDRIGALKWERGEQALQVVADTTVPAAYVRLTYTLMAGRPHLQIVYTFWFPSRPAEGRFDVLAGALDGIVWRVTLDDDGEALVYDSIHPCGCYHQFFATARVMPRAPPRYGADGEPEDPQGETLFLPQNGTVENGAGQRILLRVAARSHYLQRVLVVAHGALLPDTDSIPYHLHDDDELRSLPAPAAEGGGRRSAFGPDGLVAGTERAERYYFWPMGIASAGQMRQWGHHATAFVGRRHFDDPRLLDRYFTLRDTSSPTAADTGTFGALSQQQP